jgi:hypothetical protein
VPSVDAPANTQLVSVASYSSQDANGQITVKVNYNADSDQLTGLGLRIHFDSDVLTFADIKDVLAKDLINTDSEAQADTDNLDGNASTDSYVTVAWASLDGDWPSEALTDELLTLVFDVADDAAGSTAIGFSSSSTPVDYGFSGDAIAIDLIESPLSIDSATGEVTLSDNPDFEVQDSYAFTVIATDAAGNASAPQAVTLAVNEVDDAVPAITSADTAVAIDESSGAEQIIYTAAAQNSAGSSDGLIFSLSTDSDAALTINSDTGAVSLATDPDFEAQSQYSFAVIATDASGNASAPKAVTLNINNLDEVAPSITSGAIADAIDENSGAGQIIYTAAADDSTDISGGVIFSLAGTDAGSFTINEDSGEVSLVIDPNFEAQDSYAFTVIATDAAGNASAPQAVTLAVNNLDDAAPTITSGGTADAIDESSGAGQVVYTAAADDSGDISDGVTFSLTSNTSYNVAPELAENTQHVYVSESTLSSDGTQVSVVVSYNSLLAGTTGLGLRVHFDSNELSFSSESNVLSQDLIFSTDESISDSADYDSNSSTGTYVDVAWASVDGNWPNESTSADLITLTFDVNPDASSQTVIGFSAITSPVAVDFAGQMYDLSLDSDSMTSDSPFSIDSVSGEVTLIADPDFDSASEYSFSVIATDAAGNVSAPQAVTLAINEVDDVPPVIDSADTAIAIDENSGAGQVIYTATVDSSGDVADTSVIFSLSADSDAALTINSDTGAVSLATDPDFEAQSQYSFAVIATDAAGNASAPKAVTLNINNLDEVAPSITSGDIADAIDENSGAGQVIYTAAADDSADISGGVSYSLVDDAVYTTTVPSVDAPANTQLVSVASYSSQDANGQITVKVNYNADSDQLTGLGLRIHFDSDVLTFADIKDVLAKDLINTDSEAQADTDNLDGNASTDSYVTVAWASLDGDWPSEALTDELLTLVFDVADDAAGSTAIGFSSSSTPVDYGFSGDAIAIDLIESPLSIDSATGEVTLSDNPDFEVQDSYAFTVIATDAAGNASAPKAVTLAVNEVDDAVPAITSADTAVAIDESSGAEQIIYTAAAQNSAGSSDGLIFSLSTDSDAALTINSDTGAVSLATDPDFEAQSQYSFAVIATDASGNASAPKAVTLNINNLDEVAPSITSGAIADAIDENSGAGQIIYTAAADDSTDISGGVIFSLAGTDAGSFTINEDSGEVSLVIDPNFEAQDSYAFTVIATDAAGNASAPQAVTLAVNNLDDAAPTITSGGTADAIDESSGAGQVVYTAAADDSGDISDGVTFSLTSNTSYNVAPELAENTQHVYVSESTLSSDGTQVSVVVSYNSLLAGTTGLGLRVHFDSNELSFSSESNVLSQDLIFSTDESISDSADYDSNSSTGTYVDVAWASVDGNWPNESTSADLITLTFDVNPDASSQTVIGFSAITSPVAVDFAGQMYDLSLDSDSMTSDSPFSIDSVSGEVTLIADPDFDSASEYSFSVIATDAAGNVSAPQAVTLAINEVDDVPPVIDSADTAIAIDENSGAGQVIYTATVDSSGDVADTSVIFSLSADSDAALTINSDTGAVSLATDPDFEAQSQYSFAVIATDAAGNASAPKAVTLNINNFDEVAPSITSGDIADAIDENSGAGQVIYTAAADDSADISGGVSYSLVDDAVYTTTVPSVDAPANTQLVSVASYSSQDANGQITVKVNYNADSDQLTGLGLRIHFDSDVLTFADIKDVLAKDLINTDSEAQADTDNLDGNASTDSYVTVAWASLDGDWPSEALTDELLTLVFDVADDAAGSTAIGFSSSSTPVDYGFSGDAIAIDLIESPLSIDSATGEVTLSDNPDFEVQDSYAFTVIATDAAGNASAPQAVTLAVNNLDDAAPTITSGGTADAIDESSGAGQVVYTAAADDSGDISDGVTFSLTSNTSYNVAPELAENTQHVYVSESTLSSDGTQVSVVVSYNSLLAGTTGLGLRVHFDSNELSFSSESNVLSQDLIFSTDESISDSADYDSNSSTGTYVDVAWASVDGNWPNESTSADLITLTFDVNPDASSQTVIGFSAITSPVAVDFAGQMYDLSLDSDSMTSDSPFSIDSVSGEVTLIADPDFDSASEYSFSVIATDAAGNVSAPQAVTLAINEVDDVPPVIDSADTAIAIDENSGAGQVIYTATVDSSGDVADTSVIFSLSADSDAALTINSDTGAVSLATDPDFEAQSQYSFAVIATDAAGNASAPKAVTLNINNFDEVAPSITSGDIADAIDENSGAGQIIYTAAADDSADISAGVTFSLTGDSDPALSIDSLTGVVTLNADADYETQSQYSFAVIATDTAGNVSEAQSVTLDINNLDEVAPTITSDASNTTSVNENSGAGQVVYTATASDTDFNGLEDITFSLADDSLGFSIDADTGVVTTNADFAADYEDAQSQSFSVVATDATGNASAQQLVSVAINNLDEVAPTITSDASNTTSVNENSGADQVVYTATATDDADTSDGVTFSLADESLGFSINADTGVVTTNADFAANYEDAQSQSFTVVATDATGNTSAQQLVSVAINNLDEVAPTITSDASNTTSVNENSGAGQVVYTATASDTDFNGAQDISFSLADDSLGFSIDADTGVVTTNADFAADYESAESQSFTVVATDATGNASAQQLVSVAINNLDEVAPTITSDASNTTSVNENTGAGQVVYTATASDTDFNGLEDITFSLADENLGFSIDADTGVVTTNADFAADYENAQSQSFTVVATDATGNASTQQLVSIAINNLDEVAPSITSGAIADAIDENSGAGQVIYTAAADDSADISGGVSYSLVDDTVYTTTVPSVDAPENTQLVSVASYSSQDANGQITVKVNYNADSDQLAGLGLRIHFDSDVLTFADIKDVLAKDLINTDSEAQADTDNLDGNASTDSYVTVAWASLSGDWPSEDLPGELLTLVFDVADDTAGSTDIGFSSSSTPVDYGFSGDAIAIDLIEPLLSIDSATGEVTLSENPDFEAQDSYDFTVVATDTAGNVSNSQSVSLDINNLDDAAPTITSGGTADAIDENSGAGQVVYTATTDDSADISGGVTFSLSADSDAELTIDAVTGAVSLATDPNFEEQSEYSFAVIAIDAANNVSDTQSVTLNINNLDEVAPTITSGDSASVLESSGAGTVVYRALSDDAADISAGVTFTLSEDSDPALTIDEVTGEVTLTDEPDFTTKPSYSFTVIADDGVNQSQKAVTLTVVDEDLEAPVFTSLATVEIDENIGINQVVYTAVTDDESLVNYSLSEDSDSEFSINQDTGAVTLSTNPDHESQSEYSFTVIATDVTGNTSQQLVSVGINNLDEVAPTITSDASNTTSVNENSGAGQVVYTATASDTDFNGAQDISFSLADDSLGFSIDADTGVVTTNADFAADYENAQSQSFTVVATDATGNASAQQLVSIAINNLDEVAPSITSGDTAVAIDENSGEGQVVYTATASDTDFNGAQDITFSLADESLGFSIDADTGVVTTNADFAADYEDAQSQSFTVVATDATGNASTQQLVSIAINNLDEVAPTITSDASNTTSVNENSGAGQVVYTATASDTDFNGAQDITFSLADENLGFSIDADTGVVTTNADFAANYEDAQSQSFTVVATDATGNSSGQLVSVAINNLDEVAPSITSGDIAAAIDENTGANQVIYTATADDSLDTSAGVTFSLTGDSDPALSIDSLTGAVTLNADADYETQSQYSFAVIATDAAANVSEAQSVTLDINNLDEVAPTITSDASNTTSVNENSGAGQVVYTATASDTDFNGLEDITFSLADESLGFSIDADTGVVTTNADFAADYEDAQSQSFTVVATDATGNSSGQLVSVAINNLDEIAPSITSAVTAAAIDENSGAGQVVYTATADDSLDISAGVTFSLTGDSDPALSIDSLTGAVTLNADADYETQSQYSFAVIATDTAGNVSEAQSVTLDINNLDEVAPTITSDASNTTSVNENSGAGQVVYTATASDTDFNGLEDITFSLADESLGFSIDADTGVVTTNADFAADYENAQSQSFTVVATDATGNASAQQLVSVAINNLDEVAPSITSAITAAAIDENSGAGQVVYTATASDADFNGAQDISFSLADDSLGFSIDADTGVVTTNADFAANYEDAQSQSFTVIATDATGNASAQQLVSVAINNLDEVAPTITSDASNTTSVNENSGAGQVVYTATASDTDFNGAQDITFSLVDDSLGFSIDADTGVVTTNADFAADYEDAQSQSFTVVATDATGNASAQQLVSIAINNLDEVAPSITSAVTAAAIDENSGAGQVVYTATASDTDFNGAQDITFSLAGTDAGSFTINEDSGEVTLVADPDHETQSQYSFAVIATDAAGNASEQLVSLGINNLDDTAPLITSGDTAVAIDENSGAGQVVYTATADDSADVTDTPTTDNSSDTDSAVSTVTVPDLVAATQHVYVSSSTKSEDGTQETVVISYNAEDSTTTGLGIRVHFDSSVIDVDDISDTLLNNKIVLGAFGTDDSDHDGDVSTDQYISFAWASMSSSWPGSEGPVDLATIVFDINENATGTSAINFTSTSTAAGFSFDGQTHSLALTGATESQTQPITFTLAEGSDTALSIDPSTGAVTLSDDPDHETQSEYNFAVIATDASDNASEAQSVTLTINDLDDAAPTITSASIADTIDENSGAGQVVYTATADDSGDDVADSPITFSLSSDSDAALSIDPSTGAVTLSDDPDHEAQSEYSFAVIATDAAGNVSDAQSVTFEVNNLDEVAPVINSGGTTTAIDENSGAGQIIYTATASDTDFNGAQDITFSLAGTDAGSFTINEDSGEVILVADPNYETQSQYSFAVIATDAAGNVSDAQSVILDINNLDEVAPVVSSGTTATTIDENSGAGQVVYTATASDTDFNGAQDITFSLSGTDAGSFTINEDSGEVTLVADPDHETQSQYSFAVIATDAAGNVSDAQSVILDINNLDEVAPVVSSGTTATTIDENSGAGQVVYTATASDTDFNGAQDITFSLAGTDAGSFTINEDSGEVTLVADPDHETQSQYSFAVIATDAAGNASEQLVSLGINNLDDTAPLITSGDTAVAIDENSGAGQVVYTATADDSADVTDTPTTDNSSDTDSAVSTVTVPDLVAATQHVYVSSSTKSEDGTQETVVISYNAEDSTTTGLGIRVHFDSSVIDVDDISDTLLTNKIVLGAFGTDDSDHDGDVSTDQYISFAWASMGSSWPGSEGPVDLATIVFDINENATGTSAINFTSTSTAAGFSFDGQTHSLALTGATESQTQPITFTLAEGSDTALSIDPSTGEVTLSADPDHETQSSYNFAVIATDAAGNASDAQSVILEINDLDDAAPTITSGDTAITIDENSGAEQVVYTATADDSGDDVADSPITFTLAEGSDTELSIDPSTGEVTLSADPDHEAQSSYNFAVIATDAAGNESDAQSVTLSINDLDDAAPTITSGDTAITINENSGADQVVYTATADDSLDDVSDTPITFTLAEGSDAALSIDPSTGEVTLFYRS